MCVWIGHNITPTGLITIGTRYSSPMVKCTILILQIDLTEYREKVGSDFKMPTYPNMTAIRRTFHDVVGWYQQRLKNISVHGDERNDDRLMLHG